MIRVLFPKMCPICGDAVTKDTVLCEQCRPGYTPNPARFPIGRCNGQNVWCRGLYLYRSTIRRALLNMKFAGQSGRAEGFGQLMGQTMQGEVFDLATYVPMDKRRERQRGYNQSRLLAKHCAAVCGCPVREVLYKARYTEIQHDLQTKEERAANMAGAYGAVSLNGARVLLCDDIVTTGTTLRSCIQALEQAGAAEIQCICVAWSKEAL